MFKGYSPIVQALQGTLFTWGLTALGAATAIFISGNKRIILDSSLGFAGGVMLAASYWSLLEPALEMATSLETYGKEGEWAFIPVAIGFFLGALFVYGADVFMNTIGIENPVELMKKDRFVDSNKTPIVTIEEEPRYNLRRRKGQPENEEGYTVEQDEVEVKDTSDDQQKLMDTSHWRRILLLIIAITVHNIPEGLAVGVGFVL
jgi:zinc transporter 11